MAEKAWFLDWRPVATAPIARQPESHRVDIDIEAVTRTLSARVVPIRASQLPSLVSLAAVARTDGLFILEMVFAEPLLDTKPLRLAEDHPDAPTIETRRKLLDVEQDLLSLSQAATSAAKTVLGHTHHFHTSTGKPRLPVIDPPVSKSEDLSASAVLTCYPTRLQGDWSGVVEKGRLKNGELRSAVAVAPWRTVDPKPRLALVCLRRAYVRVYENMTAVLERDRARQKLERKSLIVSSVLVATPGGIIAYEIVAQDPFLSMDTAAKLSDLSTRSAFSWRFHTEMSQSIGEMWEMIVSALPCILCVGSLIPAVLLLVQLLRFDRRRTKLLRSSAGYFSAIQPLTDVIAPIFSGRSKPVSGLNAVVDVLRERCSAEEYRASQRQYALALLIALAALVASIHQLAGGARA